MCSLWYAAAVSASHSGMPRFVPGVRCGVPRSCARFVLALRDFGSVLAVVELYLLLTLDVAVCTMYSLRCAAALCMVCIYVCLVI